MIFRIFFCYYVIVLATDFLRAYRYVHVLDILSVECSFPAAIIVPTTYVKERTAIVRKGAPAN
jgi:hypothetical protein